MNDVSVATLITIVLAGTGVLLARPGQEIGTGGQVDKVQQAFKSRMSGNVDGAKEMLEKELSANPNNGAAWFELARVEFYRAGKTQEMDAAQEAIEKALMVDPENVRYLSFAGRIAMYNSILKAHASKADEEAQQMKKATEALEKALAQDPNHHEARLLLVSCYGNNSPERGGDRTKAEQHVKTLEEQSPVHGAEARCEFSMKNPDERLTLWTGLAEKLEGEP